MKTYFSLSIHTVISPAILDMQTKRNKIEKFTYISRNKIITFSLSLMFGRHIIELKWGIRKV